MKRRRLVPGDMVEGTTTGERVVFHETAASSGGAAVSATIRFRPTGPVSARHLHPQQTERHELLTGELWLAFSGHDGPLEIGRPVVVRAGEAHRIWNESGDTGARRERLAAILTTLRCGDTFADHNSC
jgi:hypothetical protein